MRVGATAGLVALLTLSCATGGVRPRLAPVPRSLVVMIPDSADSVVIRLTARTQSLGLEVARVSPREGYLETRWYDTGTGTSTGEPFDRLDQTIKLRFFADPWQGRTRLVAESIRRIAWDPSMPPRDLERMVPDDHPGRALLDSILAVVRPPDTTAARRDTTTARRDTTRVTPAVPHP